LGIISRIGRAAGHAPGQKSSTPEARRAGAFAQAERAVESPRYRALVLDTLAWIEGGGWSARLGRADDQAV
jgi:hypothetical protein